MPNVITDLSIVPQPGECILKHTLIHKTHTALHSTKPSGRPTTTLSSLLNKQNSKQDSSLSLHLLAPERATCYPLCNMSTTLRLPSLLCLSAHTARLPICIRSLSSAPVSPSAASRNLVTAKYFCVANKRRLVISLHKYVFEFVFIHSCSAIL